MTNKIKIGNTVAIQEWKTIKLLISKIDGNDITCIYKNKQGDLCNITVHVSLLVDYVKGSVTIGS